MKDLGVRVLTRVYLDFINSDIKINFGDRQTSTLKSKKESAYY